MRWPSLTDGLAVGAELGLAVGAPDGARLGLVDGFFVGETVGEREGARVGEVVGDNVEHEPSTVPAAEHEPLAFTYAPSTDTAGLLSIPAQIGSPSESRAFSGFMTWRIDTAGLIEEALRIDHKQTGGGDSCPPTADGGEGGCTSFAPVFYNQPLRSAIATGLLQQTVYTLSDAFLVVTDADAGSELARIDLPRRATRRVASARWPWPAAFHWWAAT